MQKHIVITGALISFSLAASAENQIALKTALPLSANEYEGVFASQCDAVPGNLVVNCGFETGDFRGWTQSGDPSYTAVDAVSHSGSFGAYLMTQLQNAYPGWNQNKRTFMWSAGQPPNWGDPFAIQGMRNRFETRTQYNTANWSRAYVQ